jgi:hypothetical protein
MSDKVSGGANSRSSLRVILRKSRVECIWSGLPQIASVHADIAESSVSASTGLGLTSETLIERSQFGVRPFIADVVVSRRAHA